MDQEELDLEVSTCGLAAKPANSRVFWEEGEGRREGGEED